MYRFRFGVVATLGTLLTLSACDSDASDDALAEAEANLGQWTYIDVEGSTCRDGSDVGIGVRLQEGADDLVIYLEGGGACFNSATCERNLSSFSEADFNARMSQTGEAGLFNTADANNPVAGWNAVYVPYCTGDLHAGSSPDNTLLAGQGVPGPQQFVGHQNVKRALGLLDANLDTPGRVLLTGSSAGGLGALVNFDATAKTFTDSQLFMVDDSGPLFFADNVLSPPLVTNVSLLYHLRAALLDADELFVSDGLEDIYAYYSREYPDARFGLVSYLDDPTFRSFYGFGQAPGDVITPAEYTDGLRDVRAQLGANWGTYFAEGTNHTFLLTPSRYTGTSAGVSLEAWLATMLSGSPTNVDPGAQTRVALAAR